MNADSFFSIGSTHQVCQDYARSGIFEDKPYVIISDGCSTAVDSDFGCRLLAKSAEANIGEPNIESFLKKTLDEMASFSNKINLSIDSLCATLLVARIIENKLQVIMVGDGAFVVEETGKTLWNIHFDSGAPYYLRYELDEKLKDDYFKRWPPVGMIDQMDYSFGEESYVSGFELKKGSLRDIAFVYEWPQEAVKNVTLFSDGINSFSEKEATSTSKQTKPIDPNVVANELTSYKNFTGEIVQRRCKRALKDHSNWMHYDDLSVASIRVNP